MSSTTTKPRDPREEVTRAPPAPECEEEEEEEPDPNARPPYLVAAPGMDRPALSRGGEDRNAVDGTTVDPTLTGGGRRGKLPPLALALALARRSCAGVAAAMVPADARRLLWGEQPNPAAMRRAVDAAVEVKVEDEAESTPHLLAAQADDDGAAKASVVPGRVAASWRAAAVRKHEAAAFRLRPARGTGRGALGTAILLRRRRLC